MEAVAEITYIQVGTYAARDPITREFQPAVPLYIRATPEAIQSEREMIGDIADVLAEKMKQYNEGIGKIKAQEKAKQKKRRDNT